MQCNGILYLVLGIVSVVVAGKDMAYLLTGHISQRLSIDGPMPDDST